MYLYNVETRKLLRIRLLLYFFKIDMPVHSYKEIKPNRSDFIIKDKELKKCLLIDMAIPAKRKTSIKVIEKLSKCNRV